MSTDRSADRGAGLRRGMAMALVALLVSMLSWAGGPVASAADIPVPPRDKLNVHGLTVSATWNAAGNYCTISAKANGYWKKAPKRKGVTNGHYLSVKIEVIAPAGYGGTLTKTLAKKSYRSKTYAVPHVGLPESFTWRADFNAAQGSGDYAARITVRVVRNVSPGLDTTAWKLVGQTGFQDGCAPFSGSIRQRR